MSSVGNRPINNSHGSVDSVVNQPSGHVDAAAGVKPVDGAVPGDAGAGGAATTGGGWDAWGIAANAAIQSTLQQQSLSFQQQFQSLHSSYANDARKMRDETQKQMAQVAAENQAIVQKKTIESGALKASVLRSQTLRQSAEPSSSTHKPPEQATDKDGKMSEAKLQQARGPAQKVETKKALGERAMQQPRTGGRMGEGADAGGGILRSTLASSEGEAGHSGKTADASKGKAKNTEKEATKKEAEQFARAKAKADAAKKEAGEKDTMSKRAAEEETRDAQEVGLATDGNASEPEGNPTGQSQGGQNSGSPTADRRANESNANVQKMNASLAAEEIDADDWSAVDNQENGAGGVDDEGAEAAVVSPGEGENDINGEPHVSALGRTKDQHQQSGGDADSYRDGLSEDGMDPSDNPLMMRRMERENEKEIVDFLAKAGVDPNDPPEVQKEKVLRGLESLSAAESERIMGQLETHFGENVNRAQAQQQEGEANVGSVPMANGRSGRGNRSVGPAGSDRMALLEEKFTQNLANQDRLAGLLEKYIAANASAQIAHAEGQERLIGAVVKSSPNYRPTYHDNPLSSLYTRSGSGSISHYEGRHQDLLVQRQGYEDVAGGLDHLARAEVVNSDEAVSRALAYEPRVTHRDGADFRLAERIVGDLDNLEALTKKINTPRSV